MNDTNNQQISAPTNTINVIVDKDYILSKLFIDLDNLVDGVDKRILELKKDQDLNIFEDFLNYQLPKWHENMCIRYATMKKAMESGLSIEDYLNKMED